VNRRRHDHAGVEIDRMFGLVGEMRRAVLHLGDLRLSIGLARPILVRELLTFALTVESDQIVDVGVSTPLSLAIRVSISR
jgi:hypothetical protein